MFLWRSLDPRILTSVLGWMADRQSRKTPPARPAAGPPHPAPDDRGAKPAGVGRDDSGAL